LLLSIIHEIAFEKEEASGSDFCSREDDDNLENILTIPSSSISGSKEAFSGVQNEMELAFELQSPALEINTPMTKNLFFWLGEFFKFRKVNFSYIRNLFNFQGAYNFSWQHTTWQKGVSFFLILSFLAAPIKFLQMYGEYNPNDLKGRVLGISELALSDLQAASNGLTDKNFADASNNFVSAGNKFLKLKQELDSVNDLVLSFGSYLPNENIKLASQSKYIFSAAASASLAGADMSTALDVFIENISDLSLALDLSHKYLRDASLKIIDMHDSLELVQINNLPQGLRGEFSLFLEKLDSLEKGIIELNNLVDDVSWILAKDDWRRYLLVFQNNTELRASGGFIGSFALLDFWDGKIKNLEVPGGGSYDTEAGLRENIIAPSPLHLVNPKWHFWDANWWPDWEKSAKKLKWFYEHSQGPSVDGVISFTPDVMEGLLEVVGPIELGQEYDGLIINHNNFWYEVQKLSERKEDETKKPKKIISDLFEQILLVLPERINKENFVNLLNIFDDLLRERHIMFYFENEKMQKRFEGYGLTGKLRSSQYDYLMIVNTNIAGGKSDLSMSQAISLESDISEDGTVINELKIKRSHLSERGADFTGVRNVNWLRVYVPLGSQLISASGFSQPDKTLFDDPESDWQSDPDLKNELDAVRDLESNVKIYNESGKTVFANWVMIDPEGDGDVVIKYRLPFKVQVKKDVKNNEGYLSAINSRFDFWQKDLLPYSLYIQKQPGAHESDLSVSVDFGSKHPVVWSYNNYNLPDNMRVDELNRDYYQAWLLE